MSRARRAEVAAAADVERLTDDALAAADRELLGDDAPPDLAAYVRSRSVHLLALRRLHVAQRELEDAEDALSRAQARARAALAGIDDAREAVVRTTREVSLRSDRYRASETAADWKASQTGRPRVRWIPPSARGDAWEPEAPSGVRLGVCEDPEARKCGRGLRGAVVRVYRGIDVRGEEHMCSRGVGGRGVALTRALPACRVGADLCASAPLGSFWCRRGAFIWCREVAEPEPFD